MIGACVRCRREFPPSKLAPLGQYPQGMTDEEWRSFIGKYGLSGDLQMTKIGKLSDGQKARLIYAVITPFSSPRE